MSSLTLRAQAFGPLQKVEWTIPEGVSAIVGPNRVGKSTLLALPRFLKQAIQGALNDAVREVFDGPSYLRNLSAPQGTLTSIGISSSSFSWDLNISFAGGSIASYSEENLRDSNGLIFHRPAGSTAGESDGQSIPLGPTPIPLACTQRLLVATKEIRKQTNLNLNDLFDRLDRDEQLTDPFGMRIVSAGSLIAISASNFYSYRTYEYQITHLLAYGSRQSSDTELLANGENVFPLLRNWRDSSETEPRFNFVLETLREAFPHVKRLDFEQAGQSVTMATRDARWPDRKLPISRESTGVITALLQLCAVASCPKAGLVTIDELETSLHPRAIQVLTEAFRQRAREENLRIVLATQSETVLDQFHDCPEQIQVLEPNQETSPRRLTDMFGADWLKQFSLGDLFAHLEFGSNREPPAGP